MYIMGLFPLDYMPEWAREAMARLASLASVPAAFRRKTLPLRRQKTLPLRRQIILVAADVLAGRLTGEGLRGIDKTSSGLERGRCATTLALRCCCGAAVALLNLFMFTVSWLHLNLKWIL